MSDENSKKICAHGTCNCVATEGSDYCSPYCEQVGRRTNHVVERDESQVIVCDCGHPTCVG